ncbi:MAG: hypothetical protein U9N34_01735, partial [Candidatus Cloacimonadota bacterium]|nr:hypothetical protein [Candidatus Cloacimonadota bacterium]
MKKHITIFMILMVFFTLSSKEINLKQSIQIAKQNNLEISLEQSAVESSKWNEINAFTNFLPKVRFNSTIVH